MSGSVMRKQMENSVKGMLNELAGHEQAAEIALAFAKILNGDPAQFQGMDAEELKSSGRLDEAIEELGARIQKIKKQATRYTGLLAMFEFAEELMRGDHDGDDEGVERASFVTEGPTINATEVPEEKREELVEEITKLVDAIADRRNISPADGSSAVSVEPPGIMRILFDAGREGADVVGVSEELKAAIESAVARFSGAELH